VQLTDCVDELVWKCALHGAYTPNIGYIKLNIDPHARDPLWWWKGVWKARCPLKSHIFFWCMMEPKVPTWDTMKKRYKEGSGWCSLCKSNEESAMHLFM